MLLPIAAVAIGAPATAQQAPRACTAADLARSDLQDGHLLFAPIRNGERIEGAIASHTDYRFEVTPSGETIESSIRVVTSSGELSRIPGARAVTFALRTGAAGKLPVVIGWQQEVVNAQGVPTGERCSAVGDATLTVRDRSHVRLEKVARRAQVQLTVRPGRQPASEASVTYEVRFRRGSAQPPSVSVPAFARYTFPFFRLGPLGHSNHRIVPGVGELRIPPGVKGVNLHGRVLIIPAAVPAGQTRRFGFSVRVLQGGKVAGGMRGGAVCRGSTRSTLRCSVRSFSSRP